MKQQIAVLNIIRAIDLEKKKSQLSFCKIKLFEEKLKEWMALQSTLMTTLF